MHSYTTGILSSFYRHAKTCIHSSFFWYSLHSIIGIYMNIVLVLNPSIRQFYCTYIPNLLLFEYPHLHRRYLHEHSAGSKPIYSAVLFRVLHDIVTTDVPCHFWRLFSVLYCTVLYCYYCTALHCTTLTSADITILFCTVLRYTVLYRLSLFVLYQGVSNIRWPPVCSLWGRRW